MKSHMRRIVVRGVTFLFKIGKADLFVRFPDGRMHHKDLSELMGLSQDNIDRGRWKKTSDGEVHPEDVARFICQELQVSLPGGEVPRSWYDKSELK